MSWAYKPFLREMDGAITRLDDAELSELWNVTKADVLLKELQSNQQLRGLTWLRGKQALLLNTQADLQVLTLDGQLTKVKNSDPEAQSM